VIGTLPTGTLPTAEISAVIHQGLTVKLADGRTGKLAVLDDCGRVIDASPDVAREAWNVAIECYKSFLVGQGHQRVRSGPLPGIGSGLAA
jgi:hypothetical protein